MANQVVVVGSINVDVFVEESLVQKQSNFSICPNSELVKTTILPGGKGANQAVAAAKMGADVSMIGVVGDDEMGHWSVNELQKLGINTEYILLSKKAQTSVIIAQGNNEKPQFLVSPGANLLITKTMINNHLELIKSADVILTQLEIPHDVVDYLATICQKWNKIIILNPDPKIDFNKNFLSKFTYITPDEYELTKIDIISIVNNKTEVIQTQGCKGAKWYTVNGMKIFPAINYKVVCTMGAGDNFSGVFAFALANNYLVEDAIKLAIKTSSYSVQTLGAQKSMPGKEFFNE